MIDRSGSAPTQIAGAGLAQPGIVGRLRAVAGSVGLGLALAGCALLGRSEGGAAPSEATDPLAQLPALCGDASVAAYLQIAGRLPASERHGSPLSFAAVDAAVEALAAPPVDAPELGPQALAAAIERALGIGTMRADLARRSVEVEEPDGASVAPGEHRLVFHDPWVGRFEGILLLPAGAGPFPAVLALPGHGDSAAIYSDLHRARDYPARGIAILALGFRAMQLDACEHELSRALLAQGLTLMGMRVYEALAALKALSQRPEIDPGRLGMIGHSGGSSTGNLVIRLAPQLRAYVSDHAVDYRHLLWYERWHCETVPDLVPLARQVDDLATARVPILRVPYGFGRRRWYGRSARESQQIVGFFVANLAARPAAPRE